MAPQAVPVYSSAAVCARSSQIDVRSACLLRAIGAAAAVLVGGLLLGDDDELAQELLPLRVVHGGIHELGRVALEVGHVVLGDLEDGLGLFDLVPHVLGVAHLVDELGGAEGLAERVLADHAHRRHGAMTCDEPSWRFWSSRWVSTYRPPPTLTPSPLSLMSSADLGAALEGQDRLVAGVAADHKASRMSRASRFWSTS